MVLNIDLFREERGGNPQLVRDSETKRYRDPSVVDRVIENDRLWRKNLFLADQLNRAKNDINKAVKELVKSKQQQEAAAQTDVLEEVLESGLKTLTELAENSFAKSEGKIPQAFPKDQLLRLDMAGLRNLSVRITQQQAAWTQAAADAAKDRDTLLAEIGNLVHESVPVSKDEANNRLERIVGDTKTCKAYSHYDLVTMVDGYDGKRGASVAGSRGFYLKGPLVFLQDALIGLALRMLQEKGYTALYTPVFMRKQVMSEVAQLSQFDEELYHVGGGDGEERYLIATSEQPIAAFHRDETLLKAELPLRYAGISNCFRKEVGAQGRDTRGIFRVHQFQKVEQFCITEPGEASWQMLNEMVANTEEFYQQLGLGYQVITIVSGELNNAAAMKYDIEAWFPGSKPATFRELASCSNCTDYQARSIRARYAGPQTTTGASDDHVHMLNATMCAATRTLCAVLETHQTETGINVPPALQPFMPNAYKTFIPFVKKPTAGNSTD